jgi:hypothetical protein
METYQFSNIDLPEIEEQQPLNEPIASLPMQRGFLIDIFQAIRCEHYTACPFYEGKQLYLKIDMEITVSELIKRISKRVNKAPQIVKKMLLKAFMNFNNHENALVLRDEYYWKWFY